MLLDRLEGKFGFKLWGLRGILKNMWAMWAKKDIVLICFFWARGNEKILMLKQVEINAILWQVGGMPLT